MPHVETDKNRRMAPASVNRTLLPVGDGTRVLLALWLGCAVRLPVEDTVRLPVGDVVGGGVIEALLLPVPLLDGVPV